MKIKHEAYLFGPFIGSLEYELFRFAPYVIYLKRNEPQTKIIVLTRSSRFDLYGQYPDVLIPLNIENDIIEKQECFSIKEYPLKQYFYISDWFVKKYKNKFNIKDHFYPSILGFRSKIKWQFPRMKMNYDFKPRKKNIEIVNNLSTTSFYNLLDLSWTKDKDKIISELNKDDINYTDLFEIEYMLEDLVDEKYSTKLGCLIEIIKRCKFLTGNLNSPLTHIALLLNKEVISINETLTDDSINLINPMKTNITFKNMEIL